MVTRGTRVFGVDYGKGGLRVRDGCAFIDCLRDCAEKLALGENFEPEQLAEPIERRVRRSLILRKELGGSFPDFVAWVRDGSVFCDLR